LIFPRLGLLQSLYFSCIDPAHFDEGYTLAARGAISPWVVGWAEKNPGRGVDMISHKRAVCHAVLFAVAGFFAASSPASAQTFNSYRCVDGTRFIVGFYPHDSRAYLQLDGRAVTLRKRLALSGTRYSGSGVTFVLTSAGASIRHLRRPATACVAT
jgi:membrane-bound inhibitor of C-type lysozyme